MTPTNPENEPVDIEALKENVDLVEFARQYTQIEQISYTGEFAGPCPMCGGDDRFHVKDNRFYCRQCYPRGGDAIDLVRLLYGLSFIEACHWLTSGTAVVPTKEPATHTAPMDNEASPANWRSPAFQESARRTLRATHSLLLSSDGTEGQAYLRGRDLHEETWRTYKLGFGRRFHPVNHENRPAIFIPWLSPDGRTINAIQHRFIEAGLAKHERYSLKPGSLPLLFGLHALRPAETLVIVEGEVNCMSLRQIGVQALSVGSETNIGSAQARALLQAQITPYVRVMIWFDDPTYSDKMASWLTEAEPFREKRILPIHAQADANDLLVGGQLARFVASL